ncbi:hypothetical protein EJF36_06000 [Bacillus sp. HMF5848]|nr:hypothetical protein EJF36_06000 [Bacillus sp. HMF5848]
MKLKFAVVTLLLSFVLAACNGGNEVENVASEDKNIKDLVHDYSVGNIDNQSASITSHHLIVTDSDENQSVYDLPEDEFFVSIAPYFNETHP